MTEATNKQAVWITGAGGLIGNYLTQLAKCQPSQHVVGLTRTQLDLLDFAAVRAAFRAQKPTAIIHCAAMSKSPDCQAQPELARKINVEATALLAELAADIPFIFFSTDLVFDGKKGDYIETDAVNPLSTYAETKVAAEQLVLANPRHTVIRTSLNCGTSPSKTSAFNEQMRHAWENGETLNFFRDEFRNPIPALITAAITWKILGRRRSGLFHVAGADKLSRAEIGELFAAQWPELKPKFKIGSLKDYQGQPRSPDTSLNCAKIEAFQTYPVRGLKWWLQNKPEDYHQHVFVHRPTRPE